MGKVARALIRHEFVERVRDKWVVTISILFAALSSAVTLYGSKAGNNAVGLTGPSLVTLASLFVPLVALILSHDAIVGEKERNTLGLLVSLPIHRFELAVAKFLGRGTALVLAVGVGMGISMLFSKTVASSVMPRLIGPTMLLGLSFLSLGLLISCLTKRQVTAASTVVVIWFALVFFYDLGLLALLLISDGVVSQGTMNFLVLANPTGLFRVQMMTSFAGTAVFAQSGMEFTAPALWEYILIWSAWIVLPLVGSGLWLTRRRVL